MQSMAKRRKIIRWGEFEKHLKAKDPEAIRMWNDFMEQIRPEAERFAKLYQGTKDDPLTGPLLDAIKNLYESESPVYRAIGFEIPFESVLGEMRDRLSHELKKVGLPPTPKKRGRYRLTDEEIARRQEIVKQAEQLKASDPRKKWKEIAYELDIPERTLRDWRHNNY